MLLYLILAVSLVNPSLAQDYVDNPNYPNSPDYTATGGITNPPAYPDYGTNPVVTPPPPQYPDYSGVGAAETTSVTSTFPTRQPTAPTSRRRRTPPRRANRMVRWYFLNGAGMPIRTAMARSYRSNPLPYGLAPFYGNRVIGSRIMRPNMAQRQPLRQRIDVWWYM